MRKIIPLGALVVMVGPSGSGKSTFCAQNFEPGEVISADAIRQELTGDFRRQDHNAAVFDEVRHRVGWRLSRGFRAVIDATHIRDGDRTFSASLGMKFGVPIIYMVVNRSGAAKHISAGWRETIRDKGVRLIDAHETTFVANEAKILAGDPGNREGAKISMVVDTRVDQFTVVNKLTRDPKMVIEELIDRGYDTIRLVGDVHGHTDALNAAMSVSDSTYVQFLGDIVDYGVGTIEATNAVADAIARGRAGGIQGNHERKVSRFIIKERARLDNLREDGSDNPDYPGFGGTISEGNAVTFNQIKAMMESARYHWETKFLGFLENTPDHIMIEANNGTFGFVHGAMHPSLFDNTIFRLPENSMSWKMAMFGQTVDGVKNTGGYPVRHYDWVEQIPARHTVVVGHDIRSTESPYVQIAASGGRAIFLDTGASKGGTLSWMELAIVERKKKFDLIEKQFGRFE